MVSCPVCDGQIDVDEEDVDEGDSLSCDECGADLKVVGTDPLEIESADELEEDEEQELEYALVLVRRHGEDFQEAVGKLDQPVSMIGQNEVLLLGPLPLRR